ncbi:MAG: LuxR C-terminal-related transcriptional regulator [Coriobacteriales bacterium]|jgi:DNA-binding CsgD family transcriptional regulator|nr:LuxR C-terminal-related transcriptional regulator [Coriobacteriales bacterium]
MGKDTREGKIATPSSVLRDEVVDILTHDFDDFAELLISRFDERYPDTAVTLLTMPERKAIIAYSNERLKAAFLAESELLAMPHGFYPTAVASLQSSAEKDFLNIIENDFFKLEMVLPFVLERIGDDPQRQREVITLTIEAFKVLTQSTIAARLSALEQHLSAQFEEALREEGSRAARREREDLAFAFERMDDTLRRVLDAADGASPDPLLIRAEMNCFRERLRGEAPRETTNDLPERGDPAKASVRALADDATKTREGRLPDGSSSSQSSAPLPLFDALTPRECEVVELIVQGKTNREIADELVISVDTVKNHLRRIFQKLDLKSRSQLAAFGAFKKVARIDVPLRPSSGEL